MTELPQPIKPDPDKVLWLTVRRALLMVAKAIEARYDVSSDDRKAA